MFYFAAIQVALRMSGLPGLSRLKYLNIYQMDYQTFMVPRWWILVIFSAVKKHQKSLTWVKVEKSCIKYIYVYVCTCCILSVDQLPAWLIIGGLFNICFDYLI